MTTGHAQDLLLEARRGGRALAALNAVNLETSQAVVSAAEAEGAPVILQFSQNAARYGGLANLLAIGRELRSAASVPVLLHFDHAESREVAEEALRLGCDSVMLESGDLSPDEYAAELAMLCELAHTRGAAVEGEFEVVSKGERHSERHPPELVAELARKTGCDWVVVDIGSKHKQAEQNASLEFARLEKLNELIGMPLVLHGASSVPVEQLIKAVGLGVAKVNVATELMNAFLSGMAEEMGQGKDVRVVLGAGRERMVEVGRGLIRALWG